MGMIEELKKQHEEVLNQIKNLINEGKSEEVDKKMAEADSLESKIDVLIEQQRRFNNKLGDISQKPNKMPDLMGFNTIDKTGTSFSNEDIYSSIEYRKAFMNHVLKGTPIPKEFINADEITKTTDIGTVIPTVLLEQIIEKIEAVGMILPLVTRTSIKGGIALPLSSVKPEASWVGEGEGSPLQKKTTTNMVFSYYKLRCAVAVTLETDTVALPIFERTLINNVVEAMTKALEQSIISGDGVGKPTGILTETPNEGQEITGTGKLEDLENAETALPIEYENNAIWIMTKKTFMHYSTLKDSTGQPIGRVNFGGYTNRPERTILGRSVVLCNYIDSYSNTLAAGMPYAILFNPKDYILNTNYNVTLKKYENNETDDLVTKAVMLVDGKVADKSSLVILRK